MFFNEKIFKAIHTPNKWTTEEQEKLSWQEKQKFNLAWATRGDPPFWDYVNEKIVGREFETKEQFTNFIKDLYYELTGKEMTLDGYGKCKQFMKGAGMSDGIISGAPLRKGGAIDTIAKIYGLE